MTSAEPAAVGGGGIHVRDGRPITVVLIEDHALLLEQLQCVCADHGLDVLATAMTAREGLQVVSARHPDVVVLSDHLPDESAINVCRELTGCDSATKVVIHALTQDPALASSAAAAGAAAMVIKSIRCDDLLDAVTQTVASGPTRKAG